MEDHRIISGAFVQKFAPYKRLDDGNPMKEHAEMIHKFMDEICHLVRSQTSNTTT